MKAKKYMALMLFGFLACQVSAHAEMISGMVTSIDPSAGKVVLTRSDDNKTLTVSVKDKSSLSSVQTGSQVTLDANKGILGGWEAQSISAGSASVGINASASTSGVSGAGPSGM